MIEYEKFLEYFGGFVESKTVRIRIIRNDPGNITTILMVLEKSDDKKVGENEEKSFHKDSAFGLPGGRAHKGETPEEAAKRELKEETGLIDISLELIAEIPHSHNHTIFLFEGKYLRGMPEPKPEDDAIIAAEFVPLSYIHDTLPYNGRSYRFYESHIGWIHRTDPHIQCFEERKLCMQNEQSEDCPKE